MALVSVLVWIGAQSHKQIQGVSEPNTSCMFCRSCWIVCVPAQWVGLHVTLMCCGNGPVGSDCEVNPLNTIWPTIGLTCGASGHGN
eukprot:6026521-Amphidinium_carterae.1